MNDIWNRPLTRRAALGAAALGTFGLTACRGGSSSPASSTSGAASSGPRRRGGTMRAAPGNFQYGTIVDPQALASDSSIKVALFNPLVDTDAKQQVYNVLAESFEAEHGDPSVWTIRIRKGIEFHHGKTLDIDDVLFTLRRMFDPKNPAANISLIKQIDLKNIKKMDQRTIRLHLSSPNSQLPVGFVGSYGGIAPVGFNPKKPIGTGPFTQKSYQPQQLWVGERFGNYWQDDKPYLDRIELRGFAQQSAALNAVLSGQIDAIDKVLPSQLPQLKARPSLKTHVIDTGDSQPLEMNCRDGSPFEDRRTREAFKLMVDREQIIKTVLAGYGEVGNDVGAFSQWSNGVDPAIEAPEQDLDKAKSLLKATGQTGMKVKLRVADIAPGMTNLAQVLAQQARKIGVTLEIDKVADPAQFYTKAWSTARAQIDGIDTESMYQLAAYYWVSDMPYNNMGYSNAKVDSLYKQALAAHPDKADKYFRPMSKIIADDGPWVVWGRLKYIDAWDEKFTGIAGDLGYGLNGYHWEDMSLA